MNGDIIWVPALEGGSVLSMRGDDFELHPGEDLSIGYRRAQWAASPSLPPATLKMLSSFSCSSRKRMVAS
ncbi:hypothetical protein P3T16_001743 [Paraburkholderia sp. GAS42]